MPNLTFQLNECAIVEKPYINGARNYCSGKISWEEGTIPFHEDFLTRDPETIAKIEAYFGAESRFKVDVGGVTKSPGRKGTKYEGRLFTKYEIRKITVTNEGKKFSAKSLVDEAKEAFGMSDETTDEEIPF